jgi:hypothetical protein
VTERPTTAVADPRADGSVVHVFLTLLSGNASQNAICLGSMVLTMRRVHFPPGPVNDALRVMEPVELIPVPTVRDIVYVLHAFCVSVAMNHSSVAARPPSGEHLFRLRSRDAVEQWAIG